MRKQELQGSGSLPIRAPSVSRHSLMSTSALAGGVMCGFAMATGLVGSAALLVNPAIAADYTAGGRQSADHCRQFGRHRPGRLGIGHPLGLYRLPRQRAGRQRRRRSAATAPPRPQRHCYRREQQRQRRTAPLRWAVSNANGSNATATGTFSNANGDFATATGDRSKANGLQATATGENSNANGH